jgi:hypothetical protein
LTRLGLSKNCWIKRSTTVRGASATVRHARVHAISLDKITNSKLLQPSLSKLIEVFIGSLSPKEVPEAF